MNTLGRWSCLLAPLLLIGGSQAAQRICEDRVVPNQFYANGLLAGGVQLKLYLDAYLPTVCADGPAGVVPPIILFPGGGFGDKLVGKHQVIIVQMAHDLAHAGFAVFVAEYRPRSWHNIPSVSETKTAEELEEYRAMVAEGPYPVETAVEALIASEDAFKLQSWISGKATEYLLDLGHAGIIGPSSGATLALSVSYMGDNLDLGDPRVRAVVDLWGDFYPHSTMTPGESPLLVVAGTDDALIEYKYTTDTMHQAFLTGVDASRITMPGVGHGFVDADIYHRIVHGTGMTVWEVAMQFFEARLQPAVVQVWPPNGLGNEMVTDELPARHRTR